MNNDGTWWPILIKLITFSDWNSTSDWTTDACESNELLLDSLKESESNDDSPNEVLLDNKEFKFFFLYNIKNLVVIN